MSIIGIGWKTVSVILIWVGILLLFIPVVGLFVGLPLLLLGFIMFFRNKKKQHSAEKEKSSSNLLFKVRPIVNSKKYLILLVLISFGLFVIGPKALRMVSAALLIVFFIMYSNLKYAEEIHSGKRIKRHFSQRVGRRFFGGGIIAIIGSFLYLMFFSYISGLMRQESVSLGFQVGGGIFLLLYALPGLLFMFAGFFLIRYSYRYSDSKSNEFAVIKPGKLVISKKKALFKDQ